MNKQIQTPRERTLFYERPFVMSTLYGQVLLWNILFPTIHGIRLSMRYTLLRDPSFHGAYFAGQETAVNGNSRKALAPNPRWGKSSSAAAREYSAGNRYRDSSSLIPSRSTGVSRGALDTAHKSCDRKKQANNHLSQMSSARRIRTSLDISSLRAP